MKCLICHNDSEKPITPDTPGFRKSGTLRYNNGRKYQRYQCMHDTCGRHQKGELIQ